MNARATGIAIPTQDPYGIAIPTRPELIVSAAAWRGASRMFKRAVVARALKTNDSAAIDAGVREFDLALDPAAAAYTSYVGGGGGNGKRDPWELAAYVGGGGGNGKVTGRATGAVSGWGYGLGAVVAFLGGAAVAVFLAHRNALRGLGVGSTAGVAELSRGYDLASESLLATSRQLSYRNADLVEAQRELGEARAELVRLQGVEGMYRLAEDSREANERAWHEAERKLREARNEAIVAQIPQNASFGGDDSGERPTAGWPNRRDFIADAE